MEDMLTILTEIAKQGIVGVVAVLAIIAAHRKDKQVTALYDRLENKTDQIAERYHTLASELNETLKALADTVIEE